MKLIQKYFPDLSRKQCEQFNALQQLYPSWNQQINVISRKDIEFLEERHILHSLSIALFFEFKANSKVLDVGTGGGFPGIPLAILYPSVHFTLTDAIGKKIKVVNDIATQIGLQNVEAYHSRVESLKGDWNFIVSRAVTAFPDFVAMCNNKISKKNIGPTANGIIYLKGGDFDDEIKAFANKATVYNISEIMDEEFFETKKIIYLPH